ncbi:MAG: hypothetical protein LQ350_005722 [Teloschistes chrysophthalmus]|nr:MAG: hypothetical protein LQ350_005722 [Niorma chrysophthalma]
MASQSDQSPNAKSPNTLPVKEAYDQWAATYDTDGNFLQALDSIMMEELLPRFISLLPPRPLIIDLGSGTARNTCRLLQIPEAHVAGLDISENMIEKGKSRCREVWDSLPPVPTLETLGFKRCDISSTEAVGFHNAEGVISTLVMEHIPLENFFAVCHKIMAPGGILLITNMHSDMGAISQAGFVDQATGDKIQTKSYAHTLSEVEEQITAKNFEILWKEERAVSEVDLEKIGERGRKWVGVKVWFGMILRKGETLAGSRG